MLEDWDGFGVWLKSDETREQNQNCQRERMREAGLDEAIPGQFAFYEYIGPKRSRGGADFQRWKPARRQCLEQVGQESPRPGGQFHQQCGNSRSMPDWIELRFWHLPMVDAGSHFAIA